MKMPFTLHRSKSGKTFYFNITGKNNAVLTTAKTQYNTKAGAIKGMRAVLTAITRVQIKGANSVFLDAFVNDKTLRS